MHRSQKRLTTLAALCTLISALLVMHARSYSQPPPSRTFTTADLLTEFGLNDGAPTTIGYITADNKLVRPTDAPGSSRQLMLLSIDDGRQQPRSVSLAMVEGSNAKQFKLPYEKVNFTIVPTASLPTATVYYAPAPTGLLVVPLKSPETVNGFYVDRPSFWCLVCKTVVHQPIVTETVMWRQAGVTGELVFDLPQLIDHTDVSLTEDQLNGLLAQGNLIYERGQVPTSPPN